MSGKDFKKFMLTFQSACETPNKKSRDLTP